MAGQALGDGRVDVQVISVGIGPITVADVEQASTSGQRILAFNVGNAHSAVTQQVLPRKRSSFGCRRAGHCLLVVLSKWAEEAA